VGEEAAKTRGQNERLLPPRSLLCSRCCRRQWWSCIDAWR